MSTLDDSTRVPAAWILGVTGCFLSAIGLIVAWQFVRLVEQVDSMSSNVAELNGTMKVLVISVEGNQSRIRDLDDRIRILEQRK